MAILLDQHVYGPILAVRAREEGHREGGGSAGMTEMTRRGGK
jgi:hypothetical protein